jgi:hypothetical protein
LAVRAPSWRERRIRLCVTGENSAREDLVAEAKGKVAGEFTGIEIVD